MHRTVSAACLYEIVRNGTVKPAVSLDEILRRERRQKKQNAQLSTSRIGGLPVDPYCAIRT